MDVFLLELALILILIEHCFVIPCFLDIGVLVWQDLVSTQFIRLDIVMESTRSTNQNTLRVTNGA